MRAKGKSIMSGSQKRLKRKGSIARGVSGPPSWNRTTPTRRVGLAIPRGSLKKEDVTQNLYAASTWSLRRVVVQFEILVPQARRHAELAKHLAWSGYALWPQL